MNHEYYFPNAMSPTQVISHHHQSTSLPVYQSTSMWAHPCLAWVSTDGTGGGFVIPKERRNINHQDRRNVVFQDRRNVNRINRKHYRKDGPLLFSVQGDYFVVDHPIFSGVEGSYQPREIEEFYTDDMHNMVVRLLESTSLRIGRRFMTCEDVEMQKHLALFEFCTSEGVRVERVVEGTYRGVVTL